MVYKTVTEMGFKNGDVVVCVESCSSAFTEGESYEVNLNSMGNPAILSEGEGFSSLSSKFELYGNWHD